MFRRLGMPMLAAAVLGLGVTAPLAQTSALSRAVAVSDHQQPAIPHPEQNVAAAAKLAEFEKRTGKKPNIVILLIDDMGYGDPGAFGGGEAIGAATPNMHADALGHHDGPSAGADRSDATDPEGRQDHGEPVG